MTGSRIRRGLGRVVLAVLAASTALLATAGPAFGESETFPVRVTWSGPPSAHADSAFSWTATVTNVGDTARDVFLQEDGGARETVQSAIPSQGTCQLHLTWRSCALGSIAAGASATVSFTSTVSGVAPFRSTVTAMPRADGGVSSHAFYPMLILDPADPLLADVRLTASGPDEVARETIGTFVGTARNHGSETAHGVVLYGGTGHDDILLRGSFDGRRCGRPAGWSPPVVECVVGDLAPGASAEIIVDVVPRASPPATAGLGLSVEQDWQGTSVLRFLEVGWSAQVGPLPPKPPGPEGGDARDLALFVTTADDPVPFGTQFTWTDTIVNRGATPSGAIRLNVGAGSTHSIVEHTNPQCTATVILSYCDLPSLPPGGSTSLTFTGFAFNPAGGATVHNDSVSNGSSSMHVSWARGIFDPDGPPADLAIEPLAQFTTAGEANSVTSWKLTNLGPNRAFGILVTDRISPSTTAHVGAGGECGLGWCTPDWLDPGQSRMVSFRTKGPDATVHHAVRVVHAGPDPAPGNDRASASAPADVGGGGGDGGGGGGGGASDVEVALVATKATVAPNEPVEIRVSARNKAVASATGLRAAIQLPDDARLLGPPAVDRGSGCTGTATLDCFLDFLPGNVTTVVRFSIDPGAAGVKTISARLSSTSPDADASNNVGSLTLQVVAPPPPTTASPSRGVVRTGTNRADVLVGTARADTLNGRGGNDRLAGGAGSDRISGGPGNDRLFGGPGNDRLVGGTGRDTVDAGSGNDIVLARDRARDRIVCRAGRDTVVADRVDVVGRDCEIVRRR